MGNILAFCEFHDASLRISALSNIAFARTAAKAHGGDVVALLVGAGAQAASAGAAKFASKVIVVEDGKLAHYLAETYAPIVARLAKEHGDWRWAVVGSQGQLVKDGMIESCAGCHDDAPMDGFFPVVD